MRIGAADTEAMLRVVFEPFVPNKVVAGGDADIPLLEGRHTRNGHATAYVCEHYVCQAPTTDPQELHNVAADPHSAPMLAQMKALLKQAHPVPVTGGEAQPGTRAKFSN